jgi:hypothetical protein
MAPVQPVPSGNYVENAAGPHKGEWITKENCRSISNDNFDSNSFDSMAYLAVAKGWLPQK